MCTGLGYGSGSESDTEDVDNASLTGHQSTAAESSDDDEELQDRIHRKKLEFERKMRELEERENGEYGVLCVWSLCTL